MNKHLTNKASLLAVLDSDAKTHEKAVACEKLAWVGGPEAVPALAALLGDEHLAAYASSGLEAIEDPGADEALRNALPKLEGRLLAGVVNSLGVRRDVAAVPDLRTLALNPKRGVASEALASLGMIGTVEAARTINQVFADGPETLRIPAAHAALVVAGRLAADGKPAPAREVLGRVVRTLPPGNISAAAKRQAASIGVSQGKS
jgi:HEAT repeat protein